MKVGKEALCGLLAAVERYWKVDHDAEYRELEARVASIRAALKGVSGVQTDRHVPIIANEVPHVTVQWTNRREDRAPEQVIERLLAADPPIHVQRPGKGQLLISVWMMRGDEHKIVGRRLRQILG